MTSDSSRRDASDEASGGTEGPSGGSAIGSPLCSRPLGGARLCSLLLGSDLGGWHDPQVGGVVAAILTSEGSLVRTQLRPPKTPDEDASLGLSGWLSRSSDRRLTVAVDVESWHQAARIVSGWHAGRAGCSCSLNRRGQLVVDPYIGGALRSALWLGHILRPWLHCICGRPSEHPPSSLRGHGRMRSLLGHVHEQDGYRLRWPADPQAWLSDSRLLAAWVADRAGMIVGHVALTRPRAGAAASAWASALRVPAGDLLCVSLLFVAPQERGSGTGDRLLDRTLEEARARGEHAALEVVSPNHDAVAVPGARLADRLRELRLATGARAVAALCPA